MAISIILKKVYPPNNRLTSHKTLINFINFPPYLRQNFYNMNLHEYQAKQLLKKFNVPVQEGIACSTATEAEEAYRQIHTQYGSKFAVVKAQIHAGGRGKGTIIGKDQRGVAVGKNAEAVKEIAQNII